MGDSTARVLQWFGLRQSLKSALVIAAIAFAMFATQAFGYASTYPNPKAQAELAASLQGIPSLGVIYGAPANLDAGTNGYLAYRVMPFMSVVISVWAFLTVTKRLRGNEEDGRWEILRMSQTSARTATLHVFLGFCCAYVIAFILATVFVCLLASSGDLHISVGVTIATVAATFMPGIVGAALGLLCSQLSVTRRRAVMYGITIIALLFVIRVIGNIVPSESWLLKLSPYGWAGLLNPALDLQVLWFLPAFIASIVIAGLGIFFADRDLGRGMLPEKTDLKPRYAMLGNLWTQTVRQNIGTYVSWLVISIVVIAVIVGVAGAIDQGTAGSISGAIQSVGQSQNLKVAFLGAGLVFAVMIWLLFTTIVIGGMRRDESRSYLDAILAGPHSRVSWLVIRLSAGLTVLATMGLVTGLIITAGASNLGLGLSIAKIFIDAIAALATSVWLLGFGALVYSILPQFATILMYVVIGLSFVIDIAGAVLKFDDFVQYFSLFHYLSFSLTDWPNWTYFWGLILTSVVMVVAAGLIFSRRDIVAE